MSAASGGPAGRRLPRRTLLAGAAAAGAGLALPGRARAAAAAPVTRTYTVPTRDAAIHLEVVHPAPGGTPVPAPVILTYSPYSALGRNGDADRWVPLGYARAYADVVGTGNSGGCWDYGGVREQRTGHDLVEWIAARPWCTGRVGMLGGSYNGTTQYAAAVTHPPHLATIVPEAAISSWYDYAYSGGVRYTLTNEWAGHQGPLAVADEGLDTPLAFDFGFAIPPPLDATSPDWAERVGSTVRPCDELEHTARGYDPDPDHGPFWDERDYRGRLGTVTIPVLVAHNWGDWNVKQVNAWEAHRALTRSRKAVLYMGTRWEGHGTPPGEEYDRLVEAWFARYLKGERNGVDAWPAVVSQTSDAAGPLAYRSYRNGPRTTPVPLYAGSSVDGSWTLGPQRRNAGRDAPPAAFTITGANTETAAASRPFARGSHLGFATPPLARDVHLLGEPEVRLQAVVGRERVAMAVSLLDLGPARYAGAGEAATATDPAAVVAVTRGWLDSRYRDGLDRAVPLRPGEPFEATVRAKPTDYVVRAGHRIVLLVQTETLEWAAPEPYPCADPSCTTFRVLYEQGRTSLTLPVAGAAGRSADLFAP